MPVPAMAVTIFKPLVMLWAGLNLIDDLSLLMRMGRLAAVVIPGGEKTDLCELCDDVMGDLLKGSEGLAAVPCGVACLKIPKCVEMCESIKGASESTGHFPCMAAGYCDPVAEGEIDADVECTVKPLFRCVPSRYCKRQRQGLKMSCVLKPGIGRWVGMKNAVGAHAGAIADGLLNQPHCGEEGAGPYCVASPKGLGAIAEALGHILSLVYGGLKTVESIETPGGDDDRQWLTFWLILTVMLFLERWLARVVLSTFPLYYEAKLGLLVWLLVGGGADTVYRKLRLVLMEKLGPKFIPSEREEEKKELTEMQETLPELVKAPLAKFDAEHALAVKKRKKDAELTPTRKAVTPVGQPDYAADMDDVDEEWEMISMRLHAIYVYILSPPGMEALRKSKLREAEQAVLLERAANQVSFQPRFVRITIGGVADGEHAELPPMDANGRADAYVLCRLVQSDGVAYPDKGASTRVAYRTTKPVWNQSIEIGLRGGHINSDGLYRNSSDVASTLIHLSVYDADVGVWGWLLRAATLTSNALAIAMGFAYITGTSDNMSTVQKRVVTLVMAAVGLIFLASFIKSKVFKADDDPVGEATIPLSLLMDQKEHALLVTLRPKPKADAQTNGDAPARSAEQPAPRNAKGGLGILKVACQCSER